MSFRDLIESAIKGDAVSFNETFNKVMGEAAVEAVDEINNPVELEDVIETLLTLGVLTEEELESEDFTEETLLELSKKTLKDYWNKANSDTSRIVSKGTAAYNRGPVLAAKKLHGTANINAPGVKRTGVKEDLDNDDEEIVHEGKSYRRGDEKYNDIKKLKKGAANLRADRKNKRQVEEEVTEEAIELDEVSRKLLKSYIDKAGTSRVKHEIGASTEKKNLLKAKTPKDREEAGSKMSNHLVKAQQRSKGITLAIRKDIGNSGLPDKKKHVKVDAKD